MSRYRCTIAGQQCQNIIEYARHCELFKCFQSKDVKDMDDIESAVNLSWDADCHDYANGLDVLIEPKTPSTTNGAGVATAAGEVNVYPNGERNE